MSTFAPAPASAAPAGDDRRLVRRRGFTAWIGDTLLLTRRSLLVFWRTPLLIVLGLVTPVMFVLLFTYVFGGSIKIPHYANYVDFLIPGIIVQTALFGGSSTSVAIADDLTKGLMDRFRSLPVGRSSILAARTLADLVRLTYTVALMLGIGVLVGFRFHNGLLPSLAGLGIALLFGYACAWLFALVGLLLQNVEAATLAGFVITFPLVFAASTFTATAAMPSWLRVFADNQPVTDVTNALRGLTQGTSGTGSDALHAIVWSVGILVVSAVLASWRFRRI